MGVERAGVLGCYGCGLRVMRGVFELPVFVCLFIPGFGPLALVSLVSPVCEPSGLVSNSVSICSPFPFGSLVLVIGLVAVFCWVHVVVLALGFVVIGV